MSSFWKDAANQEGPKQAPRLPPGQHDVRITRVVHRRKAGEEFRSKNGDRQIMLVYTDNQEREAVQMYTLTASAAFALAQVLEAAGFDLEKMDASGVTISKFGEEAFANANLVLKPRTLRVDVSYEDVNGKEQSKVVPIRNNSSTAAQGSPPEKDDIPF